MSHYLDENGDGMPDVAPDPELDSTPVVGAAADAKNRAARTFVQGLLTDLLVAAVLFAFPIFAGGSFDWTKSDWKVIGLSLAKTIVVTLLSYLARKLKISLPTTTA